MGLKVSCKVLFYLLMKWKIQVYFSWLLSMLHVYFHFLAAGMRLNICFVGMVDLSLSVVILSNRQLAQLITDRCLLVDFSSTRQHEKIMACAALCFTCVLHLGLFEKFRNHREVIAIKSGEFSIFWIFGHCVEHEWLLIWYELLRSETTLTIVPETVLYTIIRVTFWPVMVNAQQVLRKDEHRSGDDESMMPKYCTWPKLRCPCFSLDVHVFNIFSIIRMTF